MNKPSFYACAAGLMALLHACNSGNENTAQGTDTVMVSGDTVTVVGEETSDSPTGFRAGERAVATIEGKSGSSVTGTVTFTQTGENKVNMVLYIDNAPPGVHAVHLHQKGDCTAPDASSAGGHWNPTNQPHGNRETEGPHHKGDLPNFEVGPDGRGRIEREVEGWTISGTDTTHSIVNRAVVIHAKADDYKTQPSGDAGGRIGCGVIMLQATADGQ